MGNKSAKVASKYGIQEGDVLTVRNIKAMSYANFIVVKTLSGEYVLQEHPAAISGKTYPLHLLEDKNIKWGGKQEL